MLHQDMIAASDENRRGGDITSVFLTECHLKLSALYHTAYPPIIIHRVEECIFFKKNFHFKKNVYFCIWNDSRIVGQKAEDF